MKKLLIIFLSLIFASGAFAQYHGHAGYYRKPHIFISGGIAAPFYNPYYYPYYNPIYPAPYYYGQRYYRPSRLEIKIEDMRNDYADKIRSAKSDKTLSRKERRKEVRQLKRERDEAIDELKHDYYKSHY